MGLRSRCSGSTKGVYPLFISLYILKGFASSVYQNKNAAGALAAARGFLEYAVFLHNKRKCNKKAVGWCAHGLEICVKTQSMDALRLGLTTSLPPF
jgi:hypothetical protein